MHRLCNFMQLVLNLSILHHCSGILLSQKQRSLSFDRYSKCTYSYEVSIHTARGAQSTASDGYQVHALVSFFLICISCTFQNIAVGVFFSCYYFILFVILPIKQGVELFC